MAQYNRGKGKCVAWLREHATYDGNDCLTFPFNKPNGYGLFGLNGELLYAHRFMCELVNGPPPSPKHHAAHNCGNGHKACVSPKHVEWKTPSQNQYDRAADGTKSNGCVGKLTQQKANEIRALSSTMLQREIATMYGISRSQVSWVVTGKCWPEHRKRRHPNDVAALPKG